MEDFGMPSLFRVRVERYVKTPLGDFLLMNTADTTSTDTDADVDVVMDRVFFNMKKSPPEGDRVLFNMKKKFPPESERPDHKASFDAFDKKDKRYQNGLVFKAKERDLMVALLDTVMNFGNQSEQIQIWTLDHTQMPISTLLVNHFGKRLGCIDVPNPNSSIILNHPNSGYPGLSHAPVHLYSALSWEFFAHLVGLIKYGRLTGNDIRRYAFVWYDTCATRKELDEQTIEMLFKHQLLRLTGPSILALTFSWRYGPKRGVKVENLCREMVALVSKYAARHGYSLLNTEYFGNENSIKKPGAIYTQIFCILPNALNATPIEISNLTAQLNSADQIYFNKDWCMKCDAFVGKDVKILYQCDKCPNVLCSKCATREQKTSKSMECGDCDLSLLPRFNKEDDEEMAHTLVDLSKDSETTKGTKRERDTSESDYIVVTASLCPKLHRGGAKCAAVETFKTRWGTISTQIPDHPEKLSKCGHCFRNKSLKK